MNNFKAYTTATFNMIKFYSALALYLIILFAAGLIGLTVIYYITIAAIIVVQYLNITRHSFIAFIAGCVLVKTLYTIHKDAQLLKKKALQQNETSVSG